MRDAREEMSTIRDPEMRPASAQTFEADSYVVLRDVLSRETLELTSRYARLMGEIRPSFGDSQVRQSYARYGDPLMECLLDQLWPKMERASGEELWPTYSYHRVYYPGAELSLHRDRPSCEISASLCLGFEYRNSPAEYRWPLQVQRSGELLDIALEPGDLLLYAGCKLPHARPPFEAGAGSWHAQVFLHFVRRQGPFAICKFDGRPRLGLPESSVTDPELAERITALEKQLGRAELDS